MAKKKSRDWYKSGKFKSVSWNAKVTNDETKQLATLVFSKNFNDYARNLKTMRNSLKKELNNVTKQIKKIKKDDKTGDLLKQTLTKQLNAYETTRKDFLSALAALYNGCIREYNKVMDDFFASLRESQLTNQGVAAKVQSESLGSDDEGTE